MTTEATNDRRPIFRPSPWCVAGALAVAACSDPPQIVVSIDTTAGIPCEIDKIRIRASASKAATFEREVTNVRSLPVTVHLADETASGEFDLEVTGLKGDLELLRASGRLQFSSGGDLAAHVVLESTCTTQNPCALPELQAFVRTPPPVGARFECGQNVKRYSPTATTEIYRDACTTPGANAGMVLVGKTGAEKLPLSEEALTNFAFRFYGKPIRQIWAHEDGYISFAPDNPDERNDLNPGSLDRDIVKSGVPPPPQSAMVFWDNLFLSSTGVCYALEGVPGTQKLRVTWTRICLGTPPCGTDMLNFTIVLDERNNRVAFTYGDMIAIAASRAQGGSATVGIVNDATGFPGNGCSVAECDKDSGRCAGPEMKPCTYTQVFSNVPQVPRIQNVQFDPIVDAN